MTGNDELRIVSRLVPSPVLAVFGVKAGVWQDQSLNRLAPYDVRLDNFIHIGEGDPAIPDGIRINDQIRTVLALVQAACLIGSDSSFQSARRQLFFE